MKNRYKAILENAFTSGTILLYTYANNLENAKRNIEYQRKEKGLDMFFIKKLELDEKEGEEVTTSEEIKEETKEEKEIIKRIDFLDSRYYISNMGRIFSDKGSKGELIELSTNKAESGKNSISIVKKDGKQTTYSIDSIVWRTFVGDDSGRLRLIHIDGNKSNDKLSNLKKVTEDRKPKKELNLTEELKKFSKDDLLKVINSIIGA